jgi:DNA-binding IclR family transcriptional regulator
MAAPVPAVERAARILDLMAGSPGREFSAAQVATDLGIHRATCFSILACLAKLDLVRRDPEKKTYTLGPRLLRLGTASASRYRGFAAARREIFRLAEELDVGVLLCAREGWEMVLLDRIGDDQSGFNVPPPEVVTASIGPPLGAIFVAWSAPLEINEWLARSPAGSREADLESFRRSVAAVRARGYSIGSETEVEMQLEQILARLQQGERAERLAIALELADLVRTGAEGGPRPDGQPIDHLIGPIFDPVGEVALTITMFGRPGQIHGGNVGVYADPLLEGCARATKALGGWWRSRIGASTLESRLEASGSRSR